MIEKPKYAPGAKDIELAGEGRILDVLAATAQNLNGRCKCGRIQPDDVNWSAYEVEAESVETGEISTTVLILCPECEVALESSGIF